MQTEVVIEKLKQLAESRDEIGGLVLTSSRSGNANAPVDQFSDYDIVLYVRTLNTFQNDEWLSALGTVLVKWPLTPESEFGENWITRLVIFEDRVRIDFQITTETNIPPHDYDLGYQVIIDKDGFTQNFPVATKTKDFIRKPTEKEFLEMVNAFFWDATYVPKYLCRGDLFYARYMFEADLRFEHLEKMVEWYIGSRHEWKVSTNVHGRLFPKYLDQVTWKNIEATFAGVDKEAWWKAFFKMVDVFTFMAKEVAKGCGYTYPMEQEHKMMDYYRTSKDMADKLVDSLEIRVDLC